MAFDPGTLMLVPPVGALPPVGARMVRALRRLHLARAHGECEREALVVHLGSRCAVHAFHVLLDEIGHEWPEPVTLNPLCHPTLTHDERLIADCLVAASDNDWHSYEDLLTDMVSASGRRAIWHAARRLGRLLRGPAA